MKMWLTILQLVLSIILTVIVIFQQGRQQGLGAISGAADTFLTKNKSKSLDATLAKITVILAVLFVALTLVLNLSIIK